MLNLTSKENRLIINVSFIRELTKVDSLEIIITMSMKYDEKSLRTVNTNQKPRMDKNVSRETRKNPF